MQFWLSPLLLLSLDSLLKGARGAADILNTGTRVHLPVIEERGKHVRFKFE